MRWPALLLVVVGAVACGNEADDHDPALDLTCPGPAHVTFRDGGVGRPTPEDALGQLVPDSSDVTRERVSAAGGITSVTFRAYDVGGELVRRVVVESTARGWIASRVDDCE